MLINTQADNFVNILATLAPIADILTSFLLNESIRVLPANARIFGFATTISLDHDLTSFRSRLRETIKKDQNAFEIKD